MRLVLHAGAKEAFDKRGDSLLPLVHTRPHQGIAQQATPAWPQFDIQKAFSAGEIGDLVIGLSDPDGFPLQRFLAEGDHEFGLEEDGCREMRTLAESIQGRKELEPHVSLKVVEELVFRWAVDRLRGRTVAQLCDYLLPALESKVQDLWMWVPVFGLATPFQFELGRTTVTPMNPEFFNSWEQMLASHPSLDSEGLRARIGDLRRRLQGWAVCTLRITAEPERASEIALEESENALAILRVHLPQAVHPGAVSHLRPFGREAAEQCLVFRIGPENIPIWSEGVSRQVQPVMLGQELMDEIQAAGLKRLHDLYLLSKRTEFQEAVLMSVMTYSRSSLQRSVSDRLIYVFTALESLLLQNQSENIIQNVADRIAFIVEQDPKERMSVVKTVKDAYNLRSRAVHHNQPAKEREMLLAFFMVAFRFFVTVILQHDRYQTKQEFQAALDAMKYS